MNPIEDEKLLMIYFDEADKADIDACLKSPDSCRQLDQLEADMTVIEQAQDQQHQLPEDYGQQLWNQIADRLPETPGNAKSPAHFWQRLMNGLVQPQYSLAGMAMVVGLVLVAYIAGRQQSDLSSGDALQQQLLAQNIQLHLTQSEIFLTQVSNGNGLANASSTAQRLLTSNRIFKQALAGNDGQFTQQLLQELEPVLLEYANGAPAQTQQPEANWVSDQNDRQLMFRIKAMKQQLANHDEII
ncbi:hypothetical protein ACFODZ_11850 [Marinicella sediminis]|uniref:Anti sigma-E protein RseA N-terminal domain-containing protein n=1 Tax=Marinicella sediminis TaxID=1792834 RepID=A0ABV7JAE9_9GAMM|nr:hypothetical protein [Marinicella sediminis]